MREYRVILIEENRLMLERMAGVIRNTKDFQLLAKEKELRLVLSSDVSPNLILLDIDAPGNMVKVGEVIRNFPKAAILCLGAQWDGETASTVVKAGAKGYLIKPFTSEELVEAVANIGKSGQGNDCEILTFFSPKGKSGKTTLIANLALALAEKSRQQVAVIDADLQFGDMAVFFNLEPQSTIVEAVRDIKFLSPLTLNSYFVPVNDNVRVLCGTKRPELAENVRPKDFFDLLQMARSLYRYVLIDVSSGFNPISVAAADAAERVYLMAMMSGGFELEHIRRALDVFSVWPDCREKLKLVFTRVEPCTKREQDHLSELVAYPVSAVLPNEYLLVAAAANNGRMAADIKPESGLARCVDRLATAIYSGG